MIHLDRISMSKKLISPICIFPSVEFYVLNSRYEVLFEMHENFQKRSMRNRTVILSANGPLTLSIPLQKGKTKSNIKDVLISYEENWIKDYLEGIKSAYANAPFFDFYFYLTEEIINSKPKSLWALFHSCFNLTESLLQLKGHGFTDGFKKYYPNDIDIRNDKNYHDGIVVKSYNQVFEDKFAFTSKLSILDLLFNLGPESSSVLKQSKIKADKLI